MADSFTPTIAPQTDGSGNPPEQVKQQPDATESVPITEQEVGEYREQDRYLPVSFAHIIPSSPRFFFLKNKNVTLIPLKPSSSFLAAFWPPPPPPPPSSATKQNKIKKDCQCIA